ncbi:hypothetical protein VB780_03160 [Leptolyngbya sp. CCNP1308]|uniref:hypothetical protein n=1 Tax=Leptolyngbya sp. CCNP1308 TaxID=3110255 RepID=UPI002B20A263|nr:hypothetical protein [Leptolyngbya sp. CCNP1308]MEA5447553.1 hypothetical protein [Leptolyngbya sp. CCNP1308]
MAQQPILTGLEWLKAQAKVDPEAVVTVYCLGHGWIGAASGHYYLIPTILIPMTEPKDRIQYMQYSEQGI